MKNTIYLDSDFNFLLLENEEEDTGLAQTKIYINIPTSAAANQALEISVAGGAPITESIPSSTKVNFELSQQYWADNGDVEITPKNDDVTGDTITIHFPKTFTVSAALNYLFDDEFEIVAQNEDFAEGGSGSGSGSGGGSAFDFVETIRNIGFRLLDEPSNVNAYFDEVAEEVQIKWTDPADISTNEPAPATWAGTVVVRKEGSAPLHRWDGDLIVDSTTRDQYASNALIDNTLDISKKYYYGIFPYDTKGDYRYTKTVTINARPLVEKEIDIFKNGIFNGDAVISGFNISNYKQTKPIQIYGNAPISNLSEFYNSIYLLVSGEYYQELPYIENGYIRKSGTHGVALSDTGEPAGQTDSRWWIPVNRINTPLRLKLKAKTIKNNGIFGGVDTNYITAGVGSVVNGEIQLVRQGLGVSVPEWTEYEIDISSLPYIDYIMLEGYDGSPGYKDISVIAIES